MKHSKATKLKMSRARKAYWAKQKNKTNIEYKVSELMPKAEHTKVGVFRIIKDFAQYIGF